MIRTTYSDLVWTRSSSMSHPYQAIRICKSARFGDAGLLLAAYGPNIVSANLTDGSIISQWPAKDESSSVSFHR